MFLACLAFAALVAAPALRDPGRWALGHPETDTYNHLWGYWHTAARLLAGEPPGVVPGLSWPTGGKLYFIDLFGALITLPVSALFGPVVAYNSSLMLNLALACFGAWLLARRLGYGPEAAAFAGLAYGSTPQLLAQVYNGISETTAVGWLPLSLCAALAWREAPTLRRGLALGACLGASIFASFYVGLFSLLATGALLLSWTVDRPRFWIRPLVLRSGLVAALGFAALAVPPLLAFRASLSGEGALVTREEGSVSLALIGHNMTDLASFFRTGRVYSPDLRALFDEALLVVVYAGWTLLGAAIAALVAERRRPGRGVAVWPWAAGALVSFVLTLGPYLYVDGAYATLPGGGLVPLPFLALFEAFPGFSRISHAYRFAMPLGLCLSMLAAAWVHGRRRPALAGGALALLLSAELIWWSPAPLPLAVSDTSAPAWSGALGLDAPGYAAPSDGQGAVLDLPISLQVLARSRYAWDQAHHGLAVPYGLNDPTPSALLQNRLGLALVNLERSSVDTLAPELPTLDLVVGARALAAVGLRAIVVHRALYPPALRDRVLTLLEIAVGPGEVVGADTVFRLEYPAMEGDG